MNKPTSKSTLKITTAPTSMPNSNPSSKHQPKRPHPTQPVKADTVDLTYLMPSPETLSKKLTKAKSLAIKGNSDLFANLLTHVTAVPEQLNKRGKSMITRVRAEPLVTQKEPE